MRKRLLGILTALLVLLIGYGIVSRTQMPRKQDFSKLQAGQQAAVPGEITLISMKTTVRHGENGNLTIRGRPGVRYTITAVYRHTDRTLTTTQRKTAGPDGLVTWTWDVSPKTIPGSYPLTVSDGVKKMATVYTVIK